MHRKLIANIVPKVEICRTGNRWESKTYTPLKNTHKIYFDGEEFEESKWRTPNIVRNQFKRLFILNLCFCNFI